MSSRIKGMVALGTHPQQAKAIMGYTMGTGLTAAGSAQGDAFAVIACNNAFTTVGSSTGAILPSTAEIGDEIWIANGGSNALKVYPPTSGTINNASANVAASIAAGKGGIFKRVTDIAWIAVFA